MLRQLFHEAGCRAGDGNLLPMRVSRAQQFALFFAVRKGPLLSCGHTMVKVLLGLLKGNLHGLARQDAGVAAGSESDDSTWYKKQKRGRGAGQAAATPGTAPSSTLASELAAPAASSSGVCAVAAARAYMPTALLTSSG